MATVKEAAERLGVSPGRVYQLIRAGRLPVQEIDGHYVLPDDVTVTHLPLGRKVSHGNGAQTPAP